MFDIRSLYFDGSDAFDLRFQTWFAVHGAELRKKIAAHLGRKENEFKMMQRISNRRSDGAPLVRVRDGKRFYYADEQGRAVKFLETEGEEWHEITSDETVREAGPLRVLIDLWKP